MIRRKFPIFDKVLIVVASVLVHSTEAGRRLASPPCNNLTNETTTLRVLALFPYRGSFWNGEYVIPAVRLAKDEINRNDSILPGYVLELIEANSGCDRDSGIYEFVSNALHSQHQPVAIVGAGCSSSTIPIASIAGRDDVCLPQVSYGATSPFLSFSSSYPYFYRTAFSDESTSEAIISLFKNFNWKRYGIHKIGIDGVSDSWIDHSIYTLRNGIQHHIGGAEEVYSGNFILPEDSESDAFEEYVHFMDLNDRILSSGMRIGILFSANRVAGADLMCYLHNQNLVYPHIIWILIDICHITLNNSISTSKYCKGNDEFQQAKEGTICLGYNLTTTDNTISVTGKTFDQYYESYVNESIKYAEEKNDSYSSSLLNDWATLGYDSMWTLGLALHNAKEKLSQYNSSLADFSLGNKNISGIIVEELAKTNFAGASGKVSFDETRQRLLPITFSQVQKNGVLNTIGHYHPSSNSSQLGNLSFINNGDLLWSIDDPPRFPMETLLAQKWAGVLMMAFLIAGFLWNSFSMLVNFRYQHFYSIKASSPQLNYVIFAGNNLLLLSGALLVIRTITEHNMVIFSSLCQVTQWLFDLGLLLVLNMTLLKSWRIYRIFYSFKRKPGKLVTDKAIIAASISWILINTTYHIVFALVNKSNIVKEKLLPTEKNQPRQKVVYCQPPDLIGLFYVPHFLMSAALCLFAFFIRRVYQKHFNSVKYKHFNNAKNIAMFFYATIPIATICLVLSNFLSPKNGVYNLETTSLILDCIAVCCIVYMCQLTLFVPVILPLFK
ncbi:gamma-aminobutyric acid type B receptor subunit 2-like [Dysidea avara]|uniref:gamma-aminobutyric acid type B receptor subunit 2-like n=1 Tax=Dysidea avara TaxID=196820 RepID=UPI0033272869